MYKRNESFRYEFIPPIVGQFKITKIGDRLITSSSGNMQILDISQGGIKCKIPFNIDVRQQVQLTLSFVINESVLKFNGTLVWQTKKIDQYYYGIKLETDDVLYNRLKEEIKYYEQSKRK